MTVKGTFVFHCATHRVTGDFDADMSGDVPVINAVEDENGSTVTISFDKPDSETNLYYFYVPVPVGTYPDFTIQILNEDGTLVLTKTATSNKNVVTRGALLKMKTLVQPTFSGGNEGS